ncbi:TetR/AcrR family transcriptional regulator [Bacillus thermotolerans]|uniref:Transcriptional regulator, TetR family n=2 Tax=Bacillus thermotolerans TaxID=1221996 RepID=A0A0F5IAG3_BACTR|nr:TetR/AcrR family transcriptional regulator [Bacillus thermotolerans]KKB42448.1 Transcriptional regulator, TetR family [Bacillus thermotolerans]KKB44605.1 Transcriptional regulator, TetR family [Bacillus thermotolerans]
MTKKPAKERIMDTSLAMFEKHGYHGVTVDQIVEESGTSKGGFYHNFKSKDELLYEIHDVFITYVLDGAREAYSHHETPVGRLCALLLSFIKVFDLYKSHITVFYQESAYLKGEFKEEINNKRDEYRRIILQIIQEGQANGDFRKEVPAEIAAMSIIGMVNWTYKWFRKDGRFSIEEIGRIFNDLLIHSLVSEKGLQDSETQAYLLKSQPVQ